MALLNSQLMQLKMQSSNRFNSVRLVNDLLNCLCCTKNLEDKNSTANESNDNDASKSAAEKKMVRVKFLFVFCSWQLTFSIGVCLTDRVAGPLDTQGGQQEDAERVEALENNRLARRRGGDDQLDYRGEEGQQRNDNCGDAQQYWHHKQL
jgi:hypothetical protein